MTKYSTPSEEWLRKKALEEDGCEIGAGMPDHPLRVPEATMTDRVEEIEARHKAVDGDLDISPMDDCELADHEDRAFLLSTIRALQAEVGESKETEEIVYRGVYEQAVQDIDLLTGGDGEFIAVIGADHDGRNCPDPAAMKARIQSRYEALVAKNERLREALKPFANAEMRGQSAHVTDAPRLDGRKVIHRIIEGDGFDAYNRAREALKDQSHDD